MSNAGTAFRALVVKDVLTFLRDRRAIAVSVVTPILIAAFFGSMFGGEGSREIAKLPVAIVDEDQSDLSREIVADLSADAALAAVALDRAAARARVLSGKSAVAIVLPSGFGAAAPRALFGAGAKPPVELLYDPSQGFAQAIVSGLLTQHVMERVTRDLFGGGGSPAATSDALARVRDSTTLSPAERADLTAILQAVERYQANGANRAATATAPRAGGGGLTLPFSISATAIASGPAYNSYAHSFAGMSVQFILFMGVDAGIGLLLMRQSGVWRRLRAAPLSRAMLLGARLCGTTLIALVILTLVYAVAGLLFHVRIEGSVVGFAMIAVAFAALAAATGLMVAALGRSVAATRGIATLVTLMLVMLGGAWVPTFIFPTWLQRVTLLVPTHWAVSGLDAMSWRAQPFGAALAPTAVLLGFALVFALVALWRFEDTAE